MTKLKWKKKPIKTKLTKIINIKVQTVLWSKLNLVDIDDQLLGNWV